jgi:hypothetical protein
VWVFYNNPPKLRDELRKVLPGWDYRRRWNNLALPTIEQNRYDLADKIASYLALFPGDETTCRAVRAAVFSDVNLPKITFTRALDEALKTVSWERIGQRLRRKTT